NNRITKSLGTRSYKTVRQIVSKVEQEIFSELIDGRKPIRELLTFSNLVKRYLESNDHDWSLNTRTRYRYLLNNYINSGFPKNPSTKAMTIRVLNGCNNWGFKNGLTDKKEKLNGGSNWENRSRVYNDLELNLLFNELRDQDFNSFVKFAYFTGARSGEIRRLKPENIADGYLDITGKTGRRMVKITTQAANVLSNQDPLWSYSRDFVSHKFKKECRRLGIKNARFHDLRRTFGYNLIKQGMSIYKVSKLLGHSSVRTTEQHYAPLMTTEIEDFVL
ncbi:uncharacterized protein METZ01_LOCUS383542, partial [marine metagenome]